MTPRQIRTVQSTWVKILLLKDRAPQLFYEKLFETDPSLRELFRGDMRQQSAKLMQVMDAAVNGLSRLERIVRLIQELGIRHVDYGVKDADYKTVGAALIRTLQQGLGDGFTPAVRDSWFSCCALVSAEMKGATAVGPPRVQLTRRCAAASATNRRR